VKWLTSTGSARDPKSPASQTEPPQVESSPTAQV
jgi:hypothetical protein